MQNRAKMWWNIEKLADAPDFYHIVSPQVGYGWGSKPSKHCYGFEYDVRCIAHYSTVKDNGLKSKLGPQCGENIEKLADAPDFYHIVSPQVGYGWGSKPSKHCYGFEYDVRCIAHYSTVKDNGLKSKLGPQCGENIQKLADAPNFYHTVRPQVGYGWGSKPSKHCCGFEYDLRYIIQ